ncbi:MAG: crotonase/enoyl-CoA hydratase family protein [Deltaproteobacteria bacterium]|jgi:enoyl-CoA hydratase/carnithine racemase|nr:crotonase/enoyl-CoA hydratase family protein [Deltaproteobacteria bacterium]MBW2210263.1 crotonase/enoyl-CoA hydratase family protein [Deltaproteobacteria bacterium]MBW2214214.1 crotonase/enoyl-CoA hydratase family protein [Deltaproteobacteria bacterium]MBW2550380.1 crotonase/enoyl-CoA hydratase family protein [Deltaproteobacteria bacterium]MBW2627986.1 crotonase/enoyl-CoA hydratase family protein [Deltaproteobacteria bacterium]
MTDEQPRVVTERDGRIFHIVLDRADKMNAFDVRMLRELAEAVTEYESDESLWCAVLYANGDHFTAGLDLAEVGPAVRSGAPLFPEGSVDVLSLHEPRRKKPLVMAVQGWCLTIGIELLLAADIRLAAEGARFGQIEINRGIFPFGGATIRLPEIAGWGNAMRWLLTGDKFDADEALRLGLVQEVVPAGDLRAKAIEIAQTVAKRAPLGVAATIRSSRTAQLEGTDAAVAELLVIARELMDTEDAAEGVRSFLERREGDFKGR